MSVLYTITRLGTYYFSEDCFLFCRKLDEVNDSLRNTEIDLLKEENEFLIKAIEDAVNAPIELVQSPANLDYMRFLVREAALRQNAVDFIDQKLDELEK